MREGMSFRLSKRATLVALLSACPFMLSATYFWLSAPGKEWYEQDELYEMGDGIYSWLGYPLTRIIFIFRAPGQMHESDHWWALPLINFLFFAQWVIWAQLLDLAGRALDRPPGGWVASLRQVGRTAEQKRRKMHLTSWQISRPVSLQVEKF